MKESKSILLVLAVFSSPLVALPLCASYRIPLAWHTFIYCQSYNSQGCPESINIRVNDNATPSSTIYYGKLPDWGFAGIGEKTEDKIHNQGLAEAEKVFTIEERKKRAIKNTSILGGVIGGISGGIGPMLGEAIWPDEEENVPLLPILVGTSIGTLTGTLAGNFFAKTIIVNEPKDAGVGHLVGIPFGALAGFFSGGVTGGTLLWLGSWDASSFRAGVFYGGVFGAGIGALTGAIAGGCIVNYLKVSETGLLNLRNNKTSLSVPTIYLRPDPFNEKKLCQNVDLLTVRF